MKIQACLSLVLLSAALLTGCANNHGAGSPSLQDNSRPTSRLPSPGNTQRNVLMQSNTMVAPVRP